MDMKVQLFKKGMDFWLVVVVSTLLATLGRPSARQATVARHPLSVSVQQSRSHEGHAFSMYGGADVGGVPDDDNMDTRPSTLRTFDASQPDAGRSAYLQSCAACHGQQGQGMPHQGPDLRRSRFVAERNDDKLAAFVRRGRAPNDQFSVMQLFMPPSGGNPALNDAELTNVIAHVRRLQSEAAEVAQKGAETVVPQEDVGARR
jgi:disulfide bond formation protein DsbB